MKEGWSNKKFEGEGKYICSDGRYEEGTYENGQIKSGTLFGEDGKKFGGITIVDENKYKIKYKNGDLYEGPLVRGNLFGQMEIIMKVIL